MASVLECDFSNAQSRYIMADIQAKLLQQYSHIYSYSNHLLFILRIQETTNPAANARNGDIYFNPSLFLDIKTGASGLCGAIGENSIKYFKDTGYYICFDKDFTRYYLISVKELREALARGDVTYRVGSNGKRFIGEKSGLGAKGYGDVFEEHLI